MSVTQSTPLVIFDCDGVLVDSEVLSIAELKQLLDEHGLSLSSKEIEDRFQGRSLKSTLEDLNQQSGLVVGQEAIDEMNHRLFRRFQSDLTPVVGVEEFLRSLNSAVCVASSSHPERIHHSLNLVELIDYFAGNVFSSTMVKEGKPAPDLFLFACAKMGFQPHQAMVIEDSPYGIQAAKQAGMLAIGLTAGSHAQGPAFRQKLIDAGSDYVASSYQDLMDYLNTYV